MRYRSVGALPCSIEILDFPGLTAVDEPFDDGEGTRIFYAVPTEDQKVCEHCGGSLYKHGGRARSYRDSPIREYRVVIWLYARRFRCRSCKATFVQPVAGMDPAKSMTTRCVDWIRARCLRETFSHIAEEIGCDEKTVREIAHAYIDELNNVYRPYLPEWLGIDETLLGGVNRLVLTDVGQHRIIDVLNDRKERTVIDWLYSFRNSSRLQGVTMDMWGHYQKAVATVFPNAPVVIDKFHVLQMANRAVDSVRTALAARRKAEAKSQKAKKVAIAVGRQWMRDKHLLRKRPYSLARGLTGNPKATGLMKLNSWLEGEPEIKEAYDLKEALACIFEPGSTRHEAEIAFDKWRKSVPRHLRGKDQPFARILTATKSWRTEILAYFDHRRTNAYTEGANSRIKVKNRQGRGYSFKVLRARALFDPPPASWRAIAESHTQLSPSEKWNLEQFLSPMFDPSFSESAGPAISEHSCLSCGRKFRTGQGSFDRIKGHEILMICHTCRDNDRNTAQSLQGDSDSGDSSIKGHSPALWPELDTEDPDTPF